MLTSWSARVTTFVQIFLEHGARRSSHRFQFPNEIPQTTAERYELLDLLIGKTVDIAIEQGILKSTSIIVDATHTKARYNQQSPREILQDRSRKLRKAIYAIDESIKAKLPAKNMSDVLEDEIAYCQDLIQFMETKSGIAQVPKITEPLNLLKETVQDDLERLQRK